MLLEHTWLNQPLEWLRHGEAHEVIPLKAILPGIKNFFDELDKAIKDESYRPDLTLCSDSMGTKIEMILRFICKKMDIPTFNYTEHKGHILTDEKTLGMLISNLDDVLPANDMILIKYLLNEKAGLNLRNRIAHGLMDSDEYNPSVPLTLLMIILRLSQFKFEPTTN